jgi:lipoprotein-anchoring transpeptidase ErfK/SrfK
MKRFSQVFSITWLWWLYFSPQALLLFQFLPFSGESPQSQAQAAGIIPSFVASLHQPSSPSVYKPIHLEIDLSDRQVTFYEEAQPVKTYPIAIGRQGWETPTGEFTIEQMEKHPVWIHPMTRRRFSADDAQNPLGSRWMGFWTDGHNWIGFHGTSDLDSIGQAISHGCVRMYNEDIEELFDRVTLGTSVTVKP